MNIWIVNHYAIPPSMGGLVRHYYFSKYLQEKGHSVKIFTSSKIHNTDINMIQDGSLYKEQVVDGIEYTFVRSKDYKGNGMDRIANMIDLPFKMWKTMKLFYRQEKPDAIYTSSPDLFVAFFALLFGKKNHIPVVMEVRDLWPESIVEYNSMSKRNPVIQVLYQLEKWMYKKADRIIFTMEGGKDYIKDKKWDKVIDLNKVHHVNNGVDLKEFDFNAVHWTIEDSDLQNEDKFNIVYVGSIRKANHVENLVEVAEALKEQGEENILFLIYGDGNEKEDLELKCRNAGLDNIKFKGKVNKKYIPYILSKSNLNILNYKQANTWKYGGSQNKQFEYLASGTPICSNIKMGYSVIEKFACGVEENIDTTKRYVEIVKSYKEMPEDLYELQCIRARKASLYYDYEVLGSKIELILMEVCEQSRGQI